MSGKTDMLAWGSNYLETERTEHMTRSVVYVRGNSSLTVDATIGRTPFRVENFQGFLEHIESRDYLILTADITIGLPEAGDKIQETVGEQVFSYEVMAPGGEPCWRYSDSFRQTLRIHTKHVKTETIS